jgi:hypothetical protein
MRLATLRFCADAGVDAPKLKLPLPAVAPKLKPFAPIPVGAPNTPGRPGVPNDVSPNGLVVPWKVEVDPVLKPFPPNGLFLSPNGRLVSFERRPVCCCVAA